mgnify:FL=1
MVWLEVVSTVIVPAPLFLTSKILPATPTAVGRVILKVPEVASTI